MLTVSDLKNILISKGFDQVSASAFSHIERQIRVQFGQDHAVATEWNKSRCVNRSDTPLLQAFTRSGTLHLGTVTI